MYLFPLIMISFSKKLQTILLYPKERLLDWYLRILKSIFKSDFDYNRFFKAYNDVFDLRTKELQILKKLKEYCRVILLSNTDVMRYGFIKNNFPEILIFDAYILSHLEGCIKPDPRIYKAALEKAEAQADECLFIDDRGDNIDAANALGINTIHFIERVDLTAELCKFNLVF